MNNHSHNEFLLSPRFRIHRHVLFWFSHGIVLAFFLSTFQYNFGRNLFLFLIWLPVFILYSYPLVYWAVPHFLLKGKHFQFAMIILLWAAAGWYINVFFRIYVFIPVQEAVGYESIVRGGRQQLSYMNMIITAAGVVMIVLFQHWIKKQQEWMEAEKAKALAELQLLKAQVHPHFLFNTLNNIYSFSLENSPKTPGLILKLSSLLNYMLYDCKEDEVLLEKEIGIMKNYIDLEKERYGNKIEISWSIEGDMKYQYITPLLLLPFLENAFKHGTSEQLDKPWLSVDLSVKKDILKCKIVNSKNEYVPFRKEGIGIQNVKKRLAFIYPDRHELKMDDEGNFFVVSLWVQLDKANSFHAVSPSAHIPVTETAST